MAGFSHMRINRIRLPCLTMELLGPVQSPISCYVCTSYGAAVVNMIKTRTPVSFDWYVTQAMEYERKQFRGDVQRVDIWCLINTGRIA